MSSMCVFMSLLKLSRDLLKVHFIYLEPRLENP